MLVSLGTCICKFLKHSRDVVINGLYFRVNVVIYGLHIRVIMVEARF